VQKHTKQDQSVHWDLMLEAGGVLHTYRLGLAPEALLHQRTSAVKIFDHPLKFLTYEGGLSKGEGFVQIADGGTYQLLAEGQRFRQLQFEGKILKGRFVLEHVENDRWEFYFLSPGRSGST
jgi:hypothetical protein